MKKNILIKIFSILFILVLSSCVTTSNVRKEKNVKSIYVRAKALSSAGRYMESLDLMEDFPWNVSFKQRFEIKKINKLKLNVLKKINADIEYTYTLIGVYKRRMYNNKSLLFSNINRELVLLDTNALEVLLKKIDGKSQYWYGNIAFEIANRNLDEGNVEEAENYFEEVININNHPFTRKAQNLLRYINKAKQVNPLTIGVALELDMRHKAYSDRILNGIQLAVGTFTGRSLPIKLAIVDVSGNKSLIKQRVLKLIAKEKIIAIVGATNSKNSKIVAQVAQSFGVPNLSLSQDSSVAETGDYIFNASITVKEQIHSLVNYAINRAYIKNFAVLYPDDNYGKYLTQIFFDEVSKQGGNIKAVSSYETNAVDFRAPVKKLLSLFYLIPRKPEYNELKAKYKAKYSRDPHYSDLNMGPLVDFEAVFVPDGAKRASMIAPFFSLYDARVRMLGLNTWHTPIFLKRGGTYINGTVLVDGFSYEDNRVFIDKFYRIYHRKPSVFEAQSYDAAKIIVSFLKRERYNADRKSLRNYIANLNNFIGSMGRVKFIDSGVAHRKLNIYKAYSKKFVKQHF